LQVPRTAAELKKFEQHLIQAPPDKSGFGLVTTLYIKNWPEPVEPRHRDGVKWLLEVFSHPDLLKALHLHGAPAFKDGVRIYCQPWDCEAFLSEQAAVRIEHGRDAKVAALQVWSVPCPCQAKA
jgi:hypothetical protein